MTPAEATLELRGAIAYQFPDLERVRALLEAGADPRAESVPGGGERSRPYICLAIQAKQAGERGLKTAKLFNEYFPGIWNTPYAWESARGRTFTPLAHRQATLANPFSGKCPYWWWLERMVGAGLIDINARSIHGTRPIHHVPSNELPRVMAAYAALGAELAPIELSRGERALLRMRGLWVPEGAA